MSESAAGAPTLNPSWVVVKLWRFICSTRLALILILLLAVAVLIGTVLIQAPSEMVASATRYQRWVKELGNRFGPFTGIFDTLGLYRIYTTWYFRALGALLGLNILACTLNRIPRQWRQATGKPRVKVEDTFFLSGNNRAQLQPELSPEDASANLQALLRRIGYRTLVETGQGQTHIYADRFRFSPLGTIITHAGLVMMLLAVIFGGLTAKRNLIAIPDGSVRPVGLGTNLTILNEGFTEEDYPSGTPKDYRSDLVIYENGVEVKRGTIRVNTPLEYKGYRFHQSYYGNAAVIQVKDQSGATLFQDGVELTYQSDFWGKNRPTGYFLLPGTALWVEIAGTGKNLGYIDPTVHTSEVGVAIYRGDAKSYLGKLATNEPQVVEGLTITFLREKQFTGIQVARNPGVNYVWIASALIVLGAALVFYFPQRRLWCLVHQEGGNTSVRLAGAAPRTAATFTSTFEKLVAEADSSLRPKDKTT